MIAALEAEAAEPDSQGKATHGGVLLKRSLSALSLVAPGIGDIAVFLMLGLPLDTCLRFGARLLIGLVVYAFYGIRHSKVQKRETEPSSA